MVEVELDHKEELRHLKLGTALLLISDLTILDHAQKRVWLSFLSNNFIFD